MTNVADAAPVSGQAEPPARTSVRGLIAQTEIDLRLFGMLVALASILLDFHILSGGKFIQPTNMVTLAVQASGIAIIATGMVMVIVSRNIDLSVGSLVGFIAMTYALLMTDWMPNILGIGADFPFRWVIALGLGVALGAAHRRLPGLHHRLHRRALVHRHPGRPALDPRASSGTSRAAPPSPGLDPSFQLIGGGAQGSLGGTLTWVARHRRLRRDHRAARQQPPAAPAVRLPAAARCGRRSLLGVLGCAAILGAGRVRQRELLAEGPREAVRRRARHPGPARRPADPDRLPVPDHPAASA